MCAAIKGMAFPYVRTLFSALVDTSPEIWLLLLLGYPVFGLVLAWWLRKKGRFGKKEFWIQMILLAPATFVVAVMIITRPFESLIRQGAPGSYDMILAIVIMPLGIIGSFVSLIHYFLVIVREVGRKNFLIGTLILSAGAIGSLLWVKQHDQRVWEEKSEICSRSTSPKGCTLSIDFSGRSIEEKDVASVAKRARVHRISLKNPGSLSSNLCILPGLEEIHISLYIEKNPSWAGNFDCVSVLDLETQNHDLSWIPPNQNLKRLALKLTLDTQKYPNDLWTQINFSHFPNLEFLSIEYDSKSTHSVWTPLASHVPTSLKALTRLRELSLGFLSLQMETFGPQLLLIPSLETLSLSGWKLSGEFPGSLRLKKLSLRRFSNENPIKLDLFPDLEELYVEGRNIHLIAPRVGTLANLAHVEIDDANISSFPAEFAARPQMKHFKFNAPSSFLVTDTEAILAAIARRPKSNFSFKVK